MRLSHNDRAASTRVPSVVVATASVSKPRSSTQRISAVRQRSGTVGHHHSGETTVATSPAQSAHPSTSPTVTTAVRRFRLCARTPDDEPYSDPPRIDELRQVCRGLLDALDDERRACSGAATHLGAGTRLEVVGSGSLYRFAMSGPLDASSGDPVLVRLGHREVEGVVAKCEDREVDVTLSDDVGHSVAAGGELLLEAPWMITRLRQRVSEAFEVGLGTPRLFNLKAALSTLGIGEIDVASIGLTPEYEDTRRPLNEAQARAIETAFRAPLSVIAAPAGTGKTLTLGALVEASYRAGLRTLVCAPSNVAVDLQMVQACARLSDEPEFKHADVLRIGVDAGAELRTSFGPDVVLDDVIARLRPKLQERMQRLQHAVDDAAAKLTAARRAGGLDTDSEVQSLRRQLTDARAELRQVRKEAREYGHALTSEARVVGATLARVFLDPHLRGFDVVVIDEASMAHGPAVFLAAGLARKHVVVGGDPYQLAAPVRSTGVNRHWLAEDVFQRLDVVSAIRNEEDVAYLTQLTEQRRSAPAICDLQGAIWYGPSLRTAREVVARERARQNVIFGSSSLCYVDTSSLGGRGYHPWGRTFANDEHAALIADLVAYIESAGELPEVGRADGEILVLSHYRGQVHNIRRRLGNRYRDRGVSVRTVHRAQGAEATTAIFDLTLTARQPTSTSSVLTAVRPEEEGSRLLAVATSRARSRFIFVGDLAWIERSVAPESVLGRLYSHLVEHGYEIPIGEVRRTVTLPSIRVVR